jgi:hypothetical protein
MAATAFDVGTVSIVIITDKIASVRITDNLASPRLGLCLKLTERRLPF